MYIRRQLPPRAVKMLDQLTGYILSKAPDGAALAYSGGVDSGLLLAALSVLRGRGYRCAALAAESALQDPAELDFAEAEARARGVPFLRVRYFPLEIENVRFNMADRCYFCKAKMFDALCACAAEMDLSGVLDGTNAEDLKELRPGIAALRERGVISPLADLGMTKADVRAAAAELGAGWARKPAQPCAATRFETGIELLPENLDRVRSCEKKLRSMMPECDSIRVRVRGAGACVEVPLSAVSGVFAMREDVCRVLHGAGFRSAAVDLDGYKSGNMSPSEN